MTTTTRVKIIPRFTHLAYVLLGALAACGGGGAPSDTGAPVGASEMMQPGARIQAVAALSPPVANPSDPASAPGAFSEQNLAADRTSQNYFYRIPAMADLGDGVIVTAIDGRIGSSADAPQPNSITVRRSTDHGVNWSPVQTVLQGHVSTGAGDQRYGYGDPSLLWDAQARKLFMFVIYTRNKGLFDSAYGNSDEDPNVISALLLESDDLGQTWSSPRSLTALVKPFNGTQAAPAAGDVRAMFASSGQGIQLKYGPYAGRLIQQFSGWVATGSGTSTVTQAWSVYSDDHGQSWQVGSKVGSRMDENKVVELSDGSILLNSRDNARSLGGRWIARSTDGGVSYSAPVADMNLVDGGTNAALFRLFPAAAQGSREAKKLAFINPPHVYAEGRRNLTVKISCDDGVTWPGRRLLHAGASAYSTGTRLADGAFGVYYEVSSPADMRFAKFDDAWLNYVCAPMGITGKRVTAGQTFTQDITVTNQEGSTLSGAALTLQVPAGWTAVTSAVPDVAPGASVTVGVEVTVPINAAGGGSKLTAILNTSDGRTSLAEVSNTVLTPTTYNIGGVLYSGVRTDTARDLNSNPYLVGEVVSYTYTITNTNAVTVSQSPTAGNWDGNFLPPNANNCRYKTLAPGQTFNCTWARHTVSAADLAAGYFVPWASWTVTGTNINASGTTVGTPLVLVGGMQAGQEASINGVQIMLQRNDGMRNLATQPYQVGDAVASKCVIKNSNSLSATIVPTQANYQSLLPPGAGNCRYTGLAAGASYVRTAPYHLVTQSEYEQGYFIPDTTWQVSTGALTSSQRFIGDPVWLR